MRDPALESKDNYHSKYRIIDENIFNKFFETEYKIKNCIKNYFGYETGRHLHKFPIIMEIMVNPKLLEYHQKCVSLISDY